MNFELRCSRAECKYFLIFYIKNLKRKKEVCYYPKSVPYHLLQNGVGHVIATLDRRFGSVVVTIVTAESSELIKRKNLC